MKRIVSVVVFAWLVAGTMCASQRSIEEARQVAAQYLSSSTSSVRMAKKASAWQHSYTAPQTKGEPAFYVFNRGENEGFVIVSAETRARTVLGYSEHGHFDIDAIPDNMRWWLNEYAKTISSLSAQPEQPASVLSGKSLKRATKKTYVPVDTLCSTWWGQGYAYGQKCPVDADGNRSVTGCVATAAAQIMKAHNWPKQGEGSNGYWWHNSVGDSTYLEVNFGNTTYEWDLMIDDYPRSRNVTAAQENAVATLMYHCGVSCEMEYSSNGSGAFTPHMVQSLYTHFRYDAGIRSILKDYMPEEAFVDSVYADLRAGRPVMFSARTQSDAGHAFVCDGIDSEGMVHINWGWYGFYNAYFQVSAMWPEGQGTGGSKKDEAYTEQVQAFLHIRPQADGVPQYTITCEQLTISDMRIGKTDKLVVKEDILQNQSILSWRGSCMFLVYKDGELYTKATGITGLRLDPYYYYYSQTSNVSFSNLPAGNYEMVPAVSINSQSGVYEPVLVRGIGEYRCPMTVTNDSIILSEPGTPVTPVDPTEEIDPTKYTFDEIDAYYTASDGGYWDIYVLTAGFYDDDSSNEMLLRVFADSDHDNSFLGSWIEGSSVVQHCEMVLYAGNINSYTPVETENSQCTFVYLSSSQQYVFYYSLEIEGKRYSGEVKLPAGQVYAKNNDTNARITLDTSLYAAFSTTQAVALAEAQAANENSAIPYVVSGTVMRMESSVAQIKQSGVCSLYLSDGNTAMYAANTKWLDNAAFSSGLEVTVAGEGEIVGPLQNYRGTTPEINQGYFCTYTPYEEPVDPIAGDTRSETFIIDFENYIVNSEYAAYGMLFVDAKDESNSFMPAVHLQCVVARGEKTLEPGVYPVSSSRVQNSILAGYLDTYIYGSWAGYVDADSDTPAPVWYIVKGSVEIDEEGAISIEARNSYNQTVRCRLAKDVTPVESVENVSSESVSAQKIVRDGQLLILRGGDVYTVQGTKIND